MKEESLFSEHDRRQWFGIRELAELTVGLFTYGQIMADVKAGRMPGAVRRKRGEWRIPRNGAQKWFTENLERPKKLTTKN